VKVKTRAGGRETPEHDNSDQRAFCGGPGHGKTAIRKLV
jgi:hypothetical protein